MRLSAEPRVAEIGKMAAVSLILKRWAGSWMNTGWGCGWRTGVGKGRLLQTLECAWRGWGPRVGMVEDGSWSGQWGGWCNEKWGLTYLAVDSEEDGAVGSKWVTLEWSIRRIDQSVGSLKDGTLGSERVIPHFLEFRQFQELTFLVVNVTRI
jgi:hypothetical protein